MPRGDEFTPQRPKKRPPPDAIEEAPRVARRRQTEDTQRIPQSSRRRRATEDEEAPTRRIRRRPDDDDDDDYSSGSDAVSTIIPYTNPKALIAYYCGVFSLIPGLALLLGPAALILGILGIRYVSKHPTAKGTGHAITGIILGVLTSLLNWIVFLVFLSMGWIKFTQRFL